MKNLLITLSMVAGLVAGNLFAQDSLTVQNKKQNRYKNQTNAAVQDKAKAQHQTGFVDANGDGYNDNAPDHDGDGIPNGRDADYSGAKSRKGNGAKGFVDADGDGINDNALDDDNDGIPNGQDSDYTRPQDGSGRANQYGKGNTGRSKGTGSGMGSGNCDGTGPKGNSNRSGKK
jgi:hypothetical protein